MSGRKPWNRTCAWEACGAVFLIGGCCGLPGLPEEPPEVHFAVESIGDPSSVAFRFDASTSVSAHWTIATHEWDLSDSESGGGVTIEHAHETDVQRADTAVLAMTDERGRQSSVSRTVTAHPPIESEAVASVLFLISVEPVRSTTTDVAIPRKTDGDVVDICVYASH